MKHRTIDIAIIGSGPAGLAAAVKARELGLENVVVFERNDKPGGILNQFIHNGFGIEIHTFSDGTLHFLLDSYLTSLAPDLLSSYCVLT